MPTAPGFRRARRQWPETLLLTTVLLAVAALLAALPVYAATIAGSSLAQRLAGAPVAARNLRVSGEGLTEDLSTQMAATLGPLLGRRVDVRQVEIPGRQALFTDQGPQPFDEYLALQLYAFDNLAADVTLVAGRLPAAGAGDVIEAALGPEALAGVNFSRVTNNTDVATANLRLGDEVRAADGGRFRIVGVVAPTDPTADVWWGSLLPFRFQRQERNGSNAPQTVVLSLLVPPADLVARYPGFAREWRLLTDLNAITVDSAPLARTRVHDVETALSGQFVQVDSSLGDLLDAYFADLARGRATLFLLTFQAVLFALLCVGLLSAALLERRSVEFTTLAARGATPAQTAFAAAAAALPPALGAALLGPPLALAALSVWGQVTGRVVPGALPAVAWLLAAGGALAGWLIFTAAHWPAVRRPRLWDTGLAHPPARPLWRRAGLDFVLLLFGGLLVWQATTGSGASAAPQTSVTGAADPLLLLGPTLALLGAALLAARLYPLVARAAAWRWPGPALLGPYAAARLGRAEVRGWRIVVLAALATGLSLFAVLSNSSIAAHQAATARFLAGADVRAGLPIDAGREATLALAGLEGAAAASPVYRNERIRWAAELGRQSALLAVDPASFDRVARLDPAAGGPALAAILAALETPGGAAIPAVFSPDAPPQNKQVGDVVEFVVGTQRVAFEVRGIIDTFPSLRGPFLVTNLPLLEQRADFATFTEPWIGQREVWLAAGPGEAAALAAAVDRGDGPPGSGLLASAAAVERGLAGDMAARQTAAALQLNAWVVALTGIATIGLLGLLAAGGRGEELAVLRALGVDDGQRRVLLALDGIPAALAGLVAGALFGYGLARLTLPALARVLGAALGGSPLQRVAVEPAAVFSLFALLAVGFILAAALPALRPPPARAAQTALE